MPKNYNLSNKSDMKRFTKDLEKRVMEKAKTVASNSSFNATCPHCSARIEVKPGKGFCSFCGQEIDVQLNFN